MASSNINVGIEGRNSNRIMKPPGGAHTDIFGSGQEKIGINSRYAKQSQQKSSIGECFGYEHSAKDNVTQVHEIIKESNETAPEIMETPQKVVIEKEFKNGNAKGAENVKPPANVSSANNRVRVPPGGFSSGLW